MTGPAGARAALLVIGVGNPSRGDDALGPAFIEGMAEDVASWSGSLELMTDFQLQIEHALDCAGRELVVFVDASVAAPTPWSLTPVGPAPASGHTTHALSPAEVLGVAQRSCGGAPPAWVLAIRGYDFELGAPLSVRARHNLRGALAALRARLPGR